MQVFNDLATEKKDQSSLKGGKTFSDEDSSQYHCGSLLSSDETFHNRKSKSLDTERFNINPKKYRLDN